MRHWSAVLIVLVALVMLEFSLTLRSEPLRAVAVLIAAGSITYGWVGLRKKLQSRLGVILLGAGLSTLAFGCAWSGLNVARFYLYNPAMNQVGSYPTWFEIVSTAQVVVQWCGAAVALAFVVILTGSPLWIVSTVLRRAMHKAIESVLLFLFAVSIYGGLPTLMIWGWARWFRRKQQRTVPAILSLIGFTLAPASGLLAVSSVLYAHAIGGFPFYDPRLLRIYRWGGLLSLSGLAFGIARVWRPGPGTLACPRLFIRNSVVLVRVSNG